MGDKLLFSRRFQVSQAALKQGALGPVFGQRQRPQFSGPRLLVRPRLPPLAVLVIALSRLLEGKTPVEREGASSRSHKPVLEWSFRKGRAGKGLLNRLRFDEAEVIDPQPSAWPQHPVEFSQGLL